MNTHFVSELATELHREMIERSRTMLASLPPPAGSAGPID